MLTAFMKIMLLSLTLVLTYGCSSKKPQQNNASLQDQQEAEQKQQAVEQELVTIELVADEFDAANPNAETVNLELSDTKTQPVKAAAETVTIDQNEVATELEVTDPVVAEANVVQNEVATELEVTDPVVTEANVEQNEVGEYVVQKGDTLMIIAFKIYGDPGRWTDLYKLNEAKLTKDHHITAETKIKYHYPNKAFNWKVAGNPYLILRGDTLQKISHKVYVTSKLWKSIWNNNLHLIRDPNLIWAGFTLFTLPKEKALQHNKTPVMPMKQPASL